MKHVAAVARLLLDSHRATDREIARVARCCPRTVRRYRQLLRERSIAEADLVGLDGRAVNRLLNPSCGRARTAAIPWSRVTQILEAGGSVRDAWVDYRACSTGRRLGFKRFSKAVRERMRDRAVLEGGEG